MKPRIIGRQKYRRKYEDEKTKFLSNKLKIATKLDVSYETDLYEKLIYPKSFIRVENLENPTFVDAPFHSASFR